MWLYQFLFSVANDSLARLMMNYRGKMFVCYEQKRACHGLAMAGIVD
jgi:hypothetical protein